MTSTTAPARTRPASTATGPRRRATTQRRPARPPAADVAVREQHRTTWQPGMVIHAATKAVRDNSLHISLPLVGKIDLPARDELAFLGGVAILAVLGAIEWPVAAVLSVGHVLALNGRNKVIQSFGEAIEAA